MDEKTNEIISEAPALAQEAPGRRLKKALYRSLAAFVAALLLLGVTRLSALTLFKGPTDINDLHNARQGDFVKFGVSSIMGFYDETDASGNTGTYAILPMQGKFVSLRLSPRYLDSAKAIRTQTENVLNGLSTDMDQYFIVEGTVKTLSEPLHDQLYRWFADNLDWMQQIGLLMVVDDGADFVSDVVLEVDSVNGVNEGLVLAFTALAAALLLYVLVELVLMGSGFYLKGRKKKGEEPAAAEDTPEEPVSEETAETAEMETEISQEDKTEEVIDAPDSSPDGEIEEDE